MFHKYFNLLIFHLTLELSGRYEIGHPESARTRPVTVWIYICFPFKKNTCSTVGISFILYRWNTWHFWTLRWQDTRWDGEINDGKTPCVLSLFPLTSSPLSPSLPFLSQPLTFHHQNLHDHGWNPGSSPPLLPTPPTSLTKEMHKLPTIAHCHCHLIAIAHTNAKLQRLKDEFGQIEWWNWWWVYRENVAVQLVGIPTKPRRVGENSNNICLLTIMPSEDESSSHHRVTE